MSGLIREVSVLSPRRQLVEPRACVAWLGRASSPAVVSSNAAGEAATNHPPGALLRRPNVGQVVGVR
jgi:hypothetical protein